MPSEKKELLQGTLDLLILSVLSAGPRHGYSIARRIELVSKDVLSVQQGSLYPALHRLVKKDLVTAKWGVTDTNRRARIYELTETGRKQISHEVHTWRQFSLAVSSVVDIAQIS